MIILTGEPKSTGHIYKSHCKFGYPTVYLSKKGKDLKKDYRKQAKAQWKGEPLTEDLEIGIKIYFGTKRKSDWDNFHKLSMDALEGVVFENDNQIRKATVELGYDKENPRIEVEIKSNIR